MQSFVMLDISHSFEDVIVQAGFVRLTEREIDPSSVGSHEHVVVSCSAKLSALGDMEIYNIEYVHRVKTKKNG